MPLHPFKPVSAGFNLEHLLQAYMTVSRGGLRNARCTWPCTLRQPTHLQLTSTLIIILSTSTFLSSQHLHSRPHLAIARSTSRSYIFILVSFVAPTNLGAHSQPLHIAVACRFLPPSVSIPHPLPCNVSPHSLTHSSSRLRPPRAASSSIGRFPRPPPAAVES